jgi:hypothetical protein
LCVISDVVGVLDLVVGIGLLLNILALTGANRWVLSAANTFGMVSLGLLWLVFVTACESYYRHGVGKGDLVRRFGLVTAVELVVPIVAYIVPFLTA